MHWEIHCNIITYCSYSIIFSHVNHAIRAGKIKIEKRFTGTYTCAYIIHSVYYIFIYIRSQFVYGDEVIQG